MSAAATTPDVEEPLVLDEATELVPEEVFGIPRGKERFGYPRDLKAFELHSWLLTAAGGRHAVDVCLGRLLRQMVKTRGYARWGSKSFESYVSADLRSDSLRRFQYLMSIDRAIEEEPLPRIGKAWRDGKLSVSQARELIRVATQEDEDRWLDLAGKVSVEKLADQVKQTILDAKKKEGTTTGGGCGEPAPDKNGIHWVREGFSATRCVDDAWRVAVETTRRMAGYDQRLYSCVDDFAAEYASGCAVMPDSMLGDGTAAVTFDPDEDDRSRESRRWVSREIGMARKELLDLRKMIKKVKLAADPTRADEGIESLDAVELDRRIRWLLRLEGKLTWYECRLLRVVKELNLHRELGFNSLDRYAREALGFCGDRASYLAALGRRLEELPKVGEALRDGLITALQARLLVKVCAPGIQEAWIAWARHSTLEALEEAVDFIRANFDGPALPPERPLGKGRAGSSAPVVSRAGAEWTDRVEACAPETSDVVVTPVAQQAEGWYSAFAEDPETMAREMLSDAGPKRAIRFNAPEDVSSRWRMTLAHCRAGFGKDACPSESQVVAVILLNFLSEWANPEVLKASMGYKVFVRDGWRCQVPGCRSRAHLHAHHIVFRSHGGPDHEWNLVTICLAHHRMIHSGVMKVRGRAPGRLEWSMGVNANGDVRTRYINGVRVAYDVRWEAGAVPPATRSATDWRACAS